MPRSTRAAINPTMSATKAVAWGVSVGAMTPRASMARHHTASYWAATSASLRPSSDALAMILSSMSVMFDT